MASCLLGTVLGLSAQLPRAPRGHLPVPVLAGASATPVPGTSTPAGPGVLVSAGEGGQGLVASWTLPPGPVLGEGLRVSVLSPAGIPEFPPGSNRWTLAVRPGANAVALAALELPVPAAGGSYQATVTVVGPGVSRQLGPSAPFSAAPTSSTSAPGVGVAGVPLPCQGSTYGIGAVAVDGWAGYQGSYCLPPAFVGGTGAFCIDHGLDYPFGAAGYAWQASPAGVSAPLLNQYDQPADQADVARLNWVMSQWGSTADPARATAIGVIAHAVMDDYPGLSVAQLDPATFRVAGGDPAVIAADTAAMWGASAAAAAPYQVTISLTPGPYDIGHPASGTARLTGFGGGAVAGVPIDFSGSAGVSVIGVVPVRTDASGAVQFRFVPLATSLRISAATAVSLPGPDVEVWTPTGAHVPTQRVVTPGRPVAVSASVTLAARGLGQATLVKVSADPSADSVAAGFRFSVARAGASGQWVPVAVRSTTALGAMAPLSGLAAGDYRVSEDVTPAGFLGGGPWRFTLVAGERAVWTLTDAVRGVPLQIVKSGDNPVTQPVGAGVRFSVTPAAGGAGQGAAVGGDPGLTWVTGADGRTPAQAVAPGRYVISELAPPMGYRGAPPVVVDVPVARTTVPGTVVVEVADKSIPGTIVLRKTDARTGALIPGARLRITRNPPGAPGTPVGTWTSASAAISVFPLLAGTYTVSEASPPPRFALGTNPSEVVTLGPGETLDVTFSDLPIPVLAPSTTRPVTTTSSVPLPLPLPLPLPVPATVASAAPPAVAASSAPGATLAFTGSPSVRLVGWALVIGGAGIGLVGLARARRRTP